MKERSHPVVVFLVVLVLVSCNGGGEREKKEVLDTVQRYNFLLRRVYLEVNLNLMREVVTDHQMSKLYPFILDLRSRNETMISDQKTFEVKNITVQKNKASLESDETWVFFRQNVDTGEITEPEKTIHYHMRYRLLKDDGTWRVDNLEPVE